MGRKFSTKVDIHDKKEAWKLPVRITDLWFARNKDNTKTVAIEMLVKFNGYKGDKIPAVVKGSNEIEHWKLKLKENSCYIMQNFEVLCNDGGYRNSPHPFKLVFTKGTTVKEQDIPEVPLNIFHFTHFHEILSGKASPDFFNRKFTKRYSL